MWRVAIPIAYNLLQMLNVQSCSFLVVMGTVQQIPYFNDVFNKWVVPILLCCAVVLTLTEGYNRAKNCVTGK